MNRYRFEWLTLNNEKKMIDCYVDCRKINKKKCQIIKCDIFTTTVNMMFILMIIFIKSWVKSLFFFHHRSNIIMINCGWWWWWWDQWNQQEFFNFRTHTHTHTHRKYMANLIIIRGLKSLYVWRKILILIFFFTEKKKPLILTKHQTHQSFYIAVVDTEIGRKKIIFWCPMRERERKMK